MSRIPEALDVEPVFVSLVNEQAAGGRFSGVLWAPSSPIHSFSSSSIVVCWRKDGLSWFSKMDSVNLTSHWNVELGLVLENGLATGLFFCVTH